MESVDNKRMCEEESTKEWVNRQGRRFIIKYSECDKDLFKESMYVRISSRRQKKNGEIYEYLQL